METNNVGEEGLRRSLSSVRVCQGDEVAVLAETVDDGKDHCLPVHTRQCLHKVEADVGPARRWDKQR